MRSWAGHRSLPEHAFRFRPAGLSGRWSVVARVPGRRSDGGTRSSHYGPRTAQTHLTDPARMNVLLDECLPRKLKDDLPGHAVSTVLEMGWAGTKNGTLLRLAET